MAEHSITTGHTRNLDDVERKKTENNWKTREAMASWNIKMKKPKANKHRNTLEELCKNHLRKKQKEKIIDKEGSKGTKERKERKHLTPS